MHSAMQPAPPRVGPPVGPVPKKRYASSDDMGLLTVAGSLCEVTVVSAA